MKVLLSQNWIGGVTLAVLTLLIAPIAAQDTRTVLATTSIIADVAQNVAGDLLTIESLLPADTDAHAYEPTTDDAVRVAEADLIFINGAGYETFLAGLLENVGEDVQVVTVNNGVPIYPFQDDHQHEEEAGELLGILGEADVECAPHEEDEAALEEAEHEHEEGACDLHTWMNPQNVVAWTNNIAEALIEFDPANVNAYQTNADTYITELEALDAEIESLVNTLPEESRILVTNHEFLGYFAQRYSFEQVGVVIPGGTTDIEPTPQELAELVAIVQAESVPAIFAEVTANSALAEAIAQEAGVVVAPTLYSEALSEMDGPAATYLDLMRYNAQTIVAALND